MTNAQPNVAILGQPPSAWLRLLVFFGLNWTTGWIAFAMSPGGSVQTFGYEVQSIAMFPLFAPGWAAFAVGGIVHSVIVFFAAAIAFYIGAIAHAVFFFSTRANEKWYPMCAVLIGELGLAILGQTVFVDNMRSWT